MNDRNPQTPPDADAPAPKPAPGAIVTLNIGDSDSDGHADVQIDVVVEGLTVFHSKALNVPDIPHVLINVLPAAAHALGLALGGKLSPLAIFNMIRGF